MKIKLNNDAVILSLTKYQALRNQLNQYQSMSFFGRLKYLFKGKLCTIQILSYPEMDASIPTNTTDSKATCFKSNTLNLKVPQHTSIL
jgi:hypothetical protein